MSRVSLLCAAQQVYFYSFWTTTGDLWLNSGVFEGWDPSTAGCWVGTVDAIVGLCALMLSGGWVPPECTVMLYFLWLIISSSIFHDVIKLCFYNFFKISFWSMTLTSSLKMLSLFMQKQAVLLPFYLLLCAFGFCRAPILIFLLIILWLKMSYFLLPPLFFLKLIGILLSLGFCLCVLSMVVVAYV